MSLIWISRKLLTYIWKPLGYTDDKTFERYGLIGALQWYRRVLVRARCIQMGDETVLCAIEVYAACGNMYTPDYIHKVLRYTRLYRELLSPLAVQEVPTQILRV